ncbi:MAG: isoprenylcysteine carboxylmethyltransferase family protein [Caldisphaeraceae archaeon]|nr:isoprenylcysteine carboxylmethyltransferase family protein [Caldisphaeraceae archaeon]MEB3798183.1 isoprenylcysteine carboxylmethyltransferase family protein [Caldisphaeraceae archaeon]
MEGVTKGRSLKEGLWKFIYWPILWAITLGSTYVFFGDIARPGGEGLAILRVIGLVLLFWAFLILGVAGRTLRYYGHKDPNRKSFWPDKLVKVGIYSCMRHPQHLGLMLVSIALALITASPITIIASGWAVVGTLFFVIFIEEPDCFMKFGNEYYAYIKEVKAFALNPLCIIKGINYLRERGRM